MRKKIIIIPVETKTRELSYKSTLAFILADLGYKVILGRQQEVRLIWYKFSNFIYIDKSSAKTKYKLYKDIKNAGGGIGVFCEEGLVYRSKEQYLSERIDKKSFDLIDIFWCWGEKQYLHISERFNKKKLKIIESPRFSKLYKYRFNRIKNLIQTNNILFLTSFGRINKNMNEKISHLDILKKRGTFNPKIGENFYYDWENYLKKYQKCIIKLIENCCIKYPKYNFKIRIHPSESKNKYNSIIDRYSNLKYSKKDLYEEILDSKLVISSHSTSSIESKLINPSSFVYAPILDSRFEPEIIQDLCSIVRDEEDIISIIDSKELGKEKVLNSNKYFYVNKENNGYENLRNYALEISNLSNEYICKKSTFNIFIRILYSLKSKLRNILYFTGIKKDSKQVIAKCNYISKKDIINYSKEFLSKKINKTCIQYNYNLSKCSNNVFEISKI